MHRIERKVGIVITGLALTLFSGIAAGSAWGLSAEDKCEADKNKIAGKYALCRQKAEAKAIKKSATADYSKCLAKLSKRWAKAEQKAIVKGTTCIDSIADPEIQSFVKRHSDAVAAALGGGVLTGFPGTGQTTAYGTGSDGDVAAGAGLYYLDNGDGTITDYNTGLMWEKKDDSGGVHDKNDTYAWSTGTNDLDGAIATTFLAVLNGDLSGCVGAGDPDPCCSGSAAGTCAAFAGYTDWRIPNVKELQSIVDYEAFPPAVNGALHQWATCTGCTDVTLATCSCTATSFYWSSTSVTFFANRGWGVDFNNGFVNIMLKVDGIFVRAVRGGL